jgi:hypothetical protein
MGMELRRKNEPEEVSLSEINNNSVLQGDNDVLLKKVIFDDIFIIKRG